MFEDVIEIKNERLKEYSNTLDLLYITLYAIIFLISVLVIFSTNISTVVLFEHLSFNYVVANIIIAFSSLILIFLGLIEKRNTSYYNISYYVVSFYAIFFLLWTFITATTVLIKAEPFEVIFHMGLDILITILLLFRIKILGINIKEGL